MKALRYFSSVMTELVVGGATALAVWVWTQRDIVQVLSCAAVMGFLAGLTVLLITDPEAYEEEEEDDVPEKIGTSIYTLIDGQFYGRKIS